jgi:hypothetical protein
MMLLDSIIKSIFNFPELFFSPSNLQNDYAIFFFYLFFSKSLHASVIARILGIHIRATQE